jgi:hypothetical protein
MAVGVPGGLQPLLVEDVWQQVAGRAVQEFAQDAECREGDDPSLVGLEDGHVVDGNACALRPLLELHVAIQQQVARLWQSQHTDNGPHEEEQACQAGDSFGSDRPGRGVGELLHHGDRISSQPILSNDGRPLQREEEVDHLHSR